MTEKKFKKLNNKYFSLLEEENDNKITIKKVTASINAILKKRNKKRDNQRLTMMLENNEDPGTNLFKLLKTPKETVNLTKLTVEDKIIQNTDEIKSEFLKHFKNKFADNKETNNNPTEIKRKIATFF